MNEFVRKAKQKISKLSIEQIALLVESLDKENIMLSSSIESLSTGILIVDNDFHFIRANKAVERYLPLKARFNDDKGKKPVWDIIDDDYVRDFLINASKNKKSLEVSDFSVYSEDRTRFITVKVMPLVQKIKVDSEETSFLDTKISGLIIAVDDITEKKQQEILLHRSESLASLTNLAASVAHEIKNPLGAIGIHIQLLQKAIKKARNEDGLIPDKKFVENYLDVVTEEVENLNRIVVDFLFAVRPLQVDMVYSNPEVLIKKIVNFFCIEFEEKGFTLELHLCDFQDRLFIDEKLFREVIINLIQNSLHALNEKFQNNKLDGEKGKVIIASVVKDDKYFLTIYDNGIGMNDKTVEKVFEPYYTTKANGTGLGLTMVYKIVKEFKGDIEAKSKFGEGTFFTISLPIPQKDTMLLEDRGRK